MRVAIVYFSENNSNNLKEISKALAKGMEVQAHLVTLIDARLETDKILSSYKYIAFGLEASSLFSKKVPDAFRSYLASAGALYGKRCYAFVSRKGLRRFRLLMFLMALLEAQAMCIRKSDIISSKSEAESIGKLLHIE